MPIIRTCIFGMPTRAGDEDLSLALHLSTDLKDVSCHQMLVRGQDPMLQI